MIVDSDSVSIFGSLAYLWSSSGAFSFRNFVSATNSIFRITAVALATCLNRFAPSVRNRSAANGYSITLVVRRCRQ